MTGQALWCAALVLCAYFIGSFPTSVIVARKVRGIDIRSHGSGNAGATNVLRVTGWKPALTVASVDVLKGFLPALIVSRLTVTGLPSDRVLTALLVGAGAVVGHVFPVWAAFRGGKGVGTTAGVMLALFPIPCLLCVPVFVLTVTLTRIVSISSMASVCVFPFLLWAVRGTAWVAAHRFGFGVVCALSLFILFTHRSNLARLAKGTENRF